MAGTDIKVIPKASTDMKLQKTNLRLNRKGSKKSFCLEQVIIFSDFTPHCVNALAPNLAWSTSASFITKLFVCVHELHILRHHHAVRVILIDCSTTLH